MRIAMKRHPQAIILSLGGDFLGEPDQAKLQQKVREMVGMGVRQIILDLGSVKAINSCGLGSLVSTLTSMRREGGDLRLASVTPPVMNLLNITQLKGIFSLYPNAEAALSSIPALAAS